MDIFYLIPPLVAGIVGALFVEIELITSKYPQTSFVLSKFLIIPKNAKLLTYTIIYGAIGFIFMLFLNSLVAAEVIKLEGVGISNVWIQAIVVGMSVKAFLHIRLFNVRSGYGSQPFPVGMEIVTLLFEPWLLRGIELDEFNAVRGFIGEYQAQYTDLNIVKQKIRGNIPPGLPQPEKAAFLRDLQNKTTVPEAMELYLRSFGKESFERVFHF